MSRIKSIALTSGLIGCGVAAWAFAGQTLSSNQDLAAPLNPMGINGSPYGQVFAMALQGPIDTTFHVGMFGATCECDDPNHDHNQNFSQPGSLILRQSNPDTEKPVAESVSVSVTKRLEKTISVMAKATKQRTNPRPASEAQKFYLRRKAEDKLRFAYQLDPSHYANYTSLHFFLVEGIGTRPELTPSAAKLAEDTIRYCLAQDSDPRPVLTAAAACTNILQLMFEDQRNESPKFNSTMMKQYLTLLDHCIARYVTQAREWDSNGNWELLSPARIEECDTRFNFICNIRDAAEQTIVRIESGGAAVEDNPTVGISPEDHLNS